MNNSDCKIHYLQHYLRMNSGPFPAVVVVDAVSCDVLESFAEFFAVGDCDRPTSSGSCACRCQTRREDGICKNNNIIKIQHLIIIIV